MLSSEPEVCTGVDFTVDDFDGEVFEWSTDTVDMGVDGSGVDEIAGEPVCHGISKQPCANARAVIDTVNRISFAKLGRDLMLFLP